MQLRQVGKKISELILANCSSIEDFCKKFNLDVLDIRKICGGQVAAPTSFYYLLAEKLNVDVADFFEMPKAPTYGECMGHFRDPNDENIILDLIDTYIALSEANQK